MTLDELKQMIQVIEQSDIDILNIEKGDFKLYYQKPNVQKATLNENLILTQNDPITKERTNDTPAPKQQEESDVYYIKSPTIGTFYTRRNPDEEPFVQVGTIIQEGDPVCVLEAMKLFNEVTSDVSGKVVDILVEDGQVVDYNQPLFAIKLGDGHV